MPKFQENVSLAQFSNYKIGGPARFFFEAQDEADIKAALEDAKSSKTDFFTLGAGTNLLIGDDGFKGLIIRPNIKFLDASGTTVRAGAGVLMKDLLAFAAENGLAGLEWAGGLPGTLGGAIRGNAGAFKGEIKDAIEQVESFDSITLKKILRKNSECDFGYRSSIFKKKNGGEIILSATLALKIGSREKIVEAMHEKMSYRIARHPLEYPNVGSIFKNVDLRLIPENLRGQFEKIVKIDPFPVVPTAYLISQAGLKGASFGGAMISPKHPNFIVNIMEAKAADVKELIALVKKTVREKFEIDLEEEIQYI